MDTKIKYTPEDIATIERIVKSGTLQAMDKVKIVGLTTEKGRDLNGRVGMVCAINPGGKNDGNIDPYVAKYPDGRYKIEVEYEETSGKEVRPGIFTAKCEKKTFSLKRENLEMHEISPGSIGKDPEGKKMLQRHGMDIRSTAEREKEDPETAGFFPAIMQGDEKRAREILEVYKRRGCPDAGNAILDATGDAPLLGAIQHGHFGIVKVLLEYGANPNYKCNVPVIKASKVTYFNMAIQLFDYTKNAEHIVNALIDGGADVNTNSLGKGTPLAAAVKIKSNHAARMRICKKLLDKGADPNQLIEIDGPRNQALTLMAACAEDLGKYSPSDRLEVIQLLVDHGADPGKFIFMEANRGESCNCIHFVISHRLADVLRIFLSSKKGLAAVNSRRKERVNYPRENNGHLETPINMCVCHDTLELYQASRDMAVQLLKAGADVEMEDHVGLSARMWLKDRNPDPKQPHAKKKELDGLNKKARKLGPKFWDSEEVKKFIEQGDNDVAQCDNCGTWADAEFHDGSTHKTFQRCARCKKVYYCTKECQKKRWKTHKLVCKAS